MPSQRLNSSKSNDTNYTSKRKIEQTVVKTRAQRRKVVKTYDEKITQLKSLDNSKSIGGSNITKRKLESSDGMMTRAKRRKIEGCSQQFSTMDCTDSQKKKSLTKLKSVAKDVLNNKTGRLLTVVLKRLTIEDLKRAGVITSKTPNSSEKNPKVSGTNTFERKTKPEQSNVKKNSKTNKNAEVTNNERTVVPNRRNLEDGILSNSALVRPDFVVNEIIWAKIRGSAHWPAKIERIVSTVAGLICYEIIWFNDYRRSKIHRTQAYKFLHNFEKFAVKFDQIIGLRTAAFEAMYEYRRQLQ